VTGPVGPAGATGPQGAQGNPGNQGPTGAEGPVGVTGPRGVTGPQGPTGEPGPQGATGSPGLQGVQGIDGATGPVGPKGDTGAAGGVALHQVTLAVTPAVFGHAAVQVAAPGITVASKIASFLAPNDEWDADDLADLTIMGTPGDGVIEFTVSRPGPIIGPLSVFYLVG